MQVFQGVILASRDRFQKNSPLGGLPPFGGGVTSPEGYLLALWVHECQRVFSDKMITLEDKAWIDGAIKELCKSNFVPELVKQVSAVLVAPASAPAHCIDAISASCGRLTLHVSACLCLIICTAWQHHSLTLRCHEKQLPSTHGSFLWL